jgi:hypothetical protein
MSEAQEALRAELALISERLEGLERRQASSLRQLDERQAAAAAAFHQRSQILSITVAAACVLAAAALILILIRTA